MRQGSRGKNTGTGTRSRVVSRARKSAKAEVETPIAKAARKIEVCNLGKPSKRLEQALQQQKAIDEILQVMASSPGDVQPVLDAVADRAAHLCEAPFARVSLVEGDVLRAGAEYSLDGTPQPRTVPLPLKRSSIAGRAVLDRRSVHHADVVPLLETEYPDAVNARRLGLRAVLGVPLIREGEAYGAIFLFRREPRAFSASQVALVETFARQAAMAIENVRLFNETRQSLERQTATSEILRVISQSPRDVQPVFDTIVQRAVRLCEAHYGAVFRMDRGLVHLAAHHNLSERLRALWFHTFYPMAPNRGHVSGRAILTRAAVEVRDVLADKEYRGAGMAVSGFRSLLGVPLLRDGAAIGAIVIYRSKPGRFEDKHIQTLETFADQAVIAIENVRLFNETEDALEQQRASSEVLAAISSSISDAQPVFDKILEGCERVFVGKKMGGINLVDEDGSIRQAAYSGRGREDVARLFPIPAGEASATMTAILRGTVVQFTDIDHDPDVPPRARAGWKAMGIKSSLGAPMLWEGRGIGAIFIGRDFAGPFSDKEIALIKTFADQAVIAIQNARLFREIEQKSRELEAASRHKSEFLANMSHELRTPLNAIIGFSEVLHERMFGEINEKQAEYIGDILQSGQHLLSLINDILDLSKIEAGRMELELSNFNLPSTIEQTVMLVRERAVRRGITLGRTIDERLGSIHADERKVKQVLLNLLSNALKFTPEGGNIDVQAVVTEGIAEISVTDTGVGIAPEDQEAVFEEFRQVGTASKTVEGTGLGLAISRRFIELHGGRIWVTSEVGTGSTFAFTLPLQ
jgi:signal transduction histidine kinase